MDKPAPVTAKPYNPAVLWCEVRNPVKAIGSALSFDSPSCIFPGSPPEHRCGGSTGAFYLPGNPGSGLFPFGGRGNHPNE